MRPAPRTASAHGPDLSGHCEVVSEETLSSLTEMNLRYDERWGRGDPASLGVNLKHAKSSGVPNAPPRPAGLRPAQPGPPAGRLRHSPCPGCVPDALAGDGCCRPGRPRLRTATQDKAIRTSAAGQRSLTTVSIRSTTSLLMAASSGQGDMKL